MKRFHRCFAVDTTAPALRVVMLKQLSSLPDLLPMITREQAAYLRTDENSEPPAVVRWRKWFLKKACSSSGT